MRHQETHHLHRSGWLRAAVLGANDGIISTASLMMGMAAALASPQTLLATGIAGLVAGALSMAAGEYVSVSSQADVEHADLARETQELKDDPASELRELTGIYVARGLAPALAQQVAEALSQHDPLAAHARDELGIQPAQSAAPLQAALASAGAFGLGALLPIVTSLLVPNRHVIVGLTVSTLLSLALLGAVAAKAGGAPIVRGAVRVVLWGSIAMAITAGIGRYFAVPLT